MGGKIAPVSAEGLTQSACGLPTRDEHDIRPHEESEVTPGSAEGPTQSACGLPTRDRCNHTLFCLARGGLARGDTAPVSAEGLTTQLVDTPHETGTTTTPTEQLGTVLSGACPKGQKSGDEA